MINNKAVLLSRQAVRDVLIRISIAYSPERVSPLARLRTIWHCTKMYQYLTKWKLSLCSIGSKLSVQ